MKHTFFLLLIVLTTGLSNAGSVVTCIKCPRKPMCASIRSDPPRLVSSRFCGSYDYPTYCVSTNEDKYLCPNGVGQPVSYGYGYGYGYSSTNKSGFVCTSGSDCY